MDRRLSIGVGLFVVAIAAFIVWRGNAKKAAATTTSEVVAVADASVTAATDAGVALGLGLVLDAAPPPSLDAPPGTRLPDGTAVPALPDKAPKSVRFGVVLVNYVGAQGAGSNARSKREALELAQKLAEGAKADFKAAVARGDSGSIDDIGRVPRGVLEPAPEYVLFTMATGTVSEPIDTPRGFWIVKRLE